MSHKEFARALQDYRDVVGTLSDGERDAYLILVGDFRGAAQAFAEQHFIKNADKELITELTRILDTRVKALKKR